MNVLKWYGALTAARSERPVAAVPRPVLALLAVALASQLLWHGLRPAPLPSEKGLPPPPAPGILKLLALGEEAAASRALMLWLQAFDYQPGISIPFARLDYGRLSDWLDRILALDPRSNYPLLSAARVYTLVKDPDRKRLMIAFVRSRFLEDPERRWQWMAHAVFVAKHQLRDLDLALQLARELRVKTPGSVVPTWARQMELFVLEDLGDLEGARILLGGLIDSGAVKDENEMRFLTERLGSPGG